MRHSCVCPMDHGEQTHWQSFFSPSRRYPRVRRLGSPAPQLNGYDRLGGSRTRRHSETRKSDSLLLQIILSRTSSLAARERALVVPFAGMDPSVSRKVPAGSEWALTYTARILLLSRMAHGGSRRARRRVYTGKWTRSRRQRW